MEFERHFTRRDLEELFDERFSLPEDFLFGVANAAFQVEGGLNGQGEPLNDWVELERSGKVATSGEATRFWTEYPEELELASGMGLNAFRLGIEWARVQPETSVRREKVPAFDQGAIEAYSDMMAAVMKAGMEPMVTLLHFTHPFWLGLDFWLDNAKLPFFERYVEEVTVRINTLLVEKHGLRPVKYWITLNEPNALAPLTYLAGYMPHRKKGLGCTRLAWSNMVDAHCRAYDTVHRVYRENGWDRPWVTYNTIHLATYEMDKFFTDLLNARQNGIEERNLPAYIAIGREMWKQEIARCPKAWLAGGISQNLERLINRLVKRSFKLEHYKAGIDALYASPEPRKLDFLAVDYYDPFLGNMIKAPTLQDIREKRFNFNTEHWEWVLNPRAMYHFLKGETINGKGLPVMIVENGMCYKVFGGRVEARSDGATRDRFLQSYLFEAMRAVKDGIPLKGYLYWSMVDNYEWGSYDPRFGLFTVDRSRSPAKRSPVDAWGVNASKVYGELIAALRSGDRERMVEAFLKDNW